MCSNREIFYYLIRLENMNRPLIFLLLGFSTTLICSSCTKVTIKESHWESTIFIENYSSIDIDSLYLYSSTGHNYTNFEPVVFRNLSSGFISDPCKFVDIEITMLFRAFIGNDSISTKWTYPNFSIDPSGPVLVPRGTHYFGIVDCDTTEQFIEIGLMEYLHYQRRY